MEPTSLRDSPPPGRAWIFHCYLGAVIAGATGIWLSLLPGLPAQLRTAPVGLWVLATLAVVTDRRPFTTPGSRQSSTVYPSICFGFAALLAYGLGPAVLIQTMAVITRSGGRGHWLRTVFAIGQYTLAYAAASTVLRALGDRRFTLTHPRYAVIVLLAVLAWFAVSCLLVVGATRLWFGRSKPGRTTRTRGYESLSLLGLLSVAPFLMITARHNPWLLPVIVVPFHGVHRLTRLSQEQEQLSSLDPLTGLANRKALHWQVAEAIALHQDWETQRRSGRRLALVLLDLDRFKEVNDALGHHVGDRLLIEVGQRLRAAVRRQDTVARLGGDEFAILMPELTDSEAAVALARGIREALSEPVRLSGLPLDVTSSIGIAMYPEHGSDCPTLLRHADVAMYDAKRRGDAIAVYTPEIDHSSTAQLGLLGDLRRALEQPDDGQIQFHYQPQVEISSGQVVGVEALLRWKHPERGYVNPEELIKTAERSAVMQLLTLRALEEVIAQLARWSDSGIALRAAVNVSMRDLQRPDFPDQLSKLLIRHGVRPGQLQLEITEGALMADPARVLSTLRRLDRLGVALSLDDFGTGYSSMRHLRQLPLSEVKIDRSFVLGMASNDDDAAIVRSIIDLAAALGLRVVAEGVEEERTRRRLAALGCDVAQGWFYARPMPADELVNWMARSRVPHLVGSLPSMASPSAP